MTSAGTETTTISLPDVTTGSALLVRRAAPPAPQDPLSSRGPSNNLEAGDSERPEARRQARQRGPAIAEEAALGTAPGEQASGAGPDHVGSRGAGPPDSMGGENKARAPIGRRKAANAIRQSRPRVGGNKEANTRARSPEPRARAPALRSLVEPAQEARGACRRESLEWRARDVSAPCLPRHLTPSPPTACALAHLQSSEQAPPSAAASASPGERTDPAAEILQRRPSEPTPPTPERRRSSRTRFSALLIPAGARTKHACAGRAGGRERCSFGERR